MSKLFEKIAEEIKTTGAIPFHRFMELGLYCPVYGYYEKEEDKIGKRGDYFTSVSVGSLFGQLLAAQFVEWLTAAGGVKNSQYRLAEAGAHRGDLARDILRDLRDCHPELYANIRYVIVEPSSRRKEWQQQNLNEFAGIVS